MKNLEKNNRIKPINPKSVEETLNIISTQNKDSQYVKILEMDKKIHSLKDELEEVHKALYLLSEKKDELLSQDEFLRDQDFIDSISKANALIEEAIGEIVSLNIKISEKKEEAEKFIKSS